MLTMSAELVIAPEAAQDIDEAYWWYEGRRVMRTVRRPDIMGLLAKFFGAVPRDEMSGIRLDMTHPFGEVFGEHDHPELRWDA